MLSLRGCALALALGTGTLASAQITFTETFTDFTNVGGWAINGPAVTTFGTIGGNPYLRGTPDTWGVVAYSGPGVSSPFTGNYFDRMITNISADIRIDHADFPNLGNRPFTLGLVNDMGTPNDFSDDVMVFYRGPNIPDVGTGWQSYSFDVPWDAASLPSGWDVYRFDGSGIVLPTDWQLVMSNVGRVDLMFYDPDFFYIFQTWDVGIDNIAITAVPEPSTLAVLGGLSLLMARRRKKRE
jgi:hypothetical protein